jgi:hypothetical protein
MSNIISDIWNSVTNWFSGAYSSTSDSDYKPNYGPADGYGLIPDGSEREYQEFLNQQRSEGFVIRSDRNSPVVTIENNTQNDTTLRFVSLDYQNMSRTITGNSDKDMIYGGRGADTLQGAGNSDKISGKSGNDFIDGGAGSDRMWGGDGADRFIMSSGDFACGGDGADRFVIRGGGVNLRNFTEEDSIDVLTTAKVVDVEWSYDPDGKWGSPIVLNSVDFVKVRTAEGLIINVDADIEMNNWFKTESAAEKFAMAAALDAMNFC